VIVAAVVLGAALTVTRAAATPALDGEAGWAGASASTLDWDFTHGRPAPEKTSVRVMIDDRYLYVRFEAEQHEPIVATQTVDDVGQGSDDDVHISLWPAGANGFEYQFDANPRGTHYQSSTENTTYAPTWTSVGRVRPGGYNVTMRLPLNALRGDGHATWAAQFTRLVKSAGETDEWSHATGQNSTDTFAFAGRLDGLGAAVKAARTTPRIGLYGLAEAGTPATGGSTSRTGADVSLPLTQSSSLVATIHPDFSNVEIDQQTIAPTAFRRQYTEVRPFFAQGANFYDYSNCYGCPGALELYTPAIPTPRSGYQLEGKQGLFTLGALDAVGDARVDDAESIAYANRDHTLVSNYTRVSSAQSTLHDLVDYGFLGYTDHKRWAAYLEGGVERGSLVTDVRKSQRFNGGIAYNTKDDFWSVSAEEVGPQFSPVDGFVAVNDIGGYSAQGSHTFRWSSGAIESLAPSFYVERYAGSDGFGTNLFDASLGLSLFLRDKLSVGANVGSSFYRLPGDPVLHADNQQGLRIDYKYQTAAQSTLLWNTGRFGDGTLDAWQRQLGFRVWRRATVSLLAYDTDWRGDGGARQKQWLDRASVSFDLGPRASLVAGVRTIIGTAPPFPFAQTYAKMTNLSFGLSTRRAHDDFYLVYGDASAVVTRPALTLKLVHYIGAEKGT